MKLITALAALMLAAAMTLAACGDDDDDGGGEAERQAAAIALEIVATDKGIEAPDSVEAGLVEINFENSGKDAHEAQLLELRGGHTVEDALEVIATGEEGAPIPEWLRGAGGVGTTKPGATSTATQVLDPGQYAVVDTEGEKPRSAEFEVTGEPSEAEVPEADATVTASEYTFDSSGLKAGKNTIRFENTGEELHHLIAIPAKADATIEKITQFFRTEKGEPPFRGDEEDTVGTSVLDAGQAQVTELELTRGKYALACFITDRKGGPPHVDKGMITVEEIQ